MALTLRRRLHGTRGAELVELAIVLPLLLALVAGIVDFAFMFQAFSVITNAAREGARMRSLPGYTNADVTARVANYVSAAGLTSVTPVTTVTAVTIGGGGGGAPAAPGFQVEVQYLYSFTLLSPLLSTVNLTATSVMRSEL